jgi:XTP/dITP diphosphohydrolase
VKTFVATKNLGKLEEMRAIFAGSLLELETYVGYADVIEGAEGYIENARLKARALYQQLQENGVEAAVLADDSGLEVGYLDGRPGVLSARYAGKDASWKKRRLQMLSELEGVPLSARGATFVSAMVLLLTDGSEITAIGTLRGNIAMEERGNAGFGYDPIFIPENKHSTFAEYSFDEKNSVSHRKKAADSLLAQLFGK